MPKPILTLQRKPGDSEGTFGMIHAEGRPMWVTLERPPGANKPMSCIPAGVYDAQPFTSPTKGKVFLLQNVPGRTMIEIHPGNTIDDTQGCILVGTAYGQVNGKNGITGSRNAITAMLAAYQYGFTLTITEDL